MRFQKGISGNPHGRPPKSRTLSLILEEYAQQTHLYQGEMLPAARILADMLWQFALQMEVTTPGGRTLQAENVMDWLNTARWVYEHIDGPARFEPPDTIEVVVVREDMPIRREDQFVTGY